MTSVFWLRQIPMEKEGRKTYYNTYICTYSLVSICRGCYLLLLVHGRPPPPSLSPHLWRKLRTCHRFISIAFIPYQVRVKLYPAELYTFHQWTLRAPDVSLGFSLIRAIPNIRSLASRIWSQVIVIFKCVVLCWVQARHQTCAPILTIY